jgi:hypothetical protein
MARIDDGKQRVPTALEVLLARLSIVDAHPRDCPCPACTREGDARRVDPPFVMLELSKGAA